MIGFCTVSGSMAFSKRNNLQCFKHGCCMQWKKDVLAAA